MENSIDNTNQNVMQQSGGQLPIPNSTAILVLGIISIPTCICYGIIGIVIGIIALALAGKAKKIYMESPEQYTLQSFNNMKAGKICAIIGTILSSLWLVYYIFLIAIIGGSIGGIFESMPWDSLDF